MENLLHQIGMLISDLRQGIELEVDKRKLNSLRKECKRISFMLSYRFHENVKGLSYLLDFHKWEAARLVEVVIKMETFQQQLAEVGIENEPLQDMHTELIVQLSELMIDIDVLISKADKSQRPFFPE